MTDGLFDRIAPVYDRMNRILSLGLDLAWRRKAARMLRAAPGAGAARSILDIASGTGDFAFALARAFPRAAIRCADPSRAMLSAAAEKAAARGLSGALEFSECPASPMPFRAGAFDIAACAFGFRNFPDRAAAFSECARVLRPGGLLCVLEFTRLRPAAMAAVSCWLRAASLLAFRHRADYAHLRRSICAMPRSEGFAEEARAAGFETLRIRLLPPACTFFLFRR